MERHYLLGLFSLWVMAASEAQTCPGGLEDIPYSYGPKPNMLIGIGTPRSGSTFLFDKLASHPQIVPSHPKAVHFFDRPDLEVSRESFGEYLRSWGNEWLLDALVERNVLMEFTPSYLSSPMAPCHVKRMFPDAKFIISVRDPTYSLLSHINEQRDMCLRGASENSKCCTDHTPLKPWLQRDFQNLKAYYEECFDTFARDPWWACPNDDKFEVYTTMYGPQIARWMTLFHPSQFIFINFEDLSLAAEVQIQRIINFAGVSSAWGLTKYEDVQPESLVNTFYVETNFYETLIFLKQELQEPLEDFYRLLEDKGIFLRRMHEEGFGNKTFVLTKDSLSQCCQLHYCEPETILANVPLSLGNEDATQWKPVESSWRKSQVLSRQANEFFYLQLALLLLGWTAALLLVARRKPKRVLRGCTSWTEI